MALTDGLESYWPLDEASGTRADAHGANHLTDNNTVGSATGKIGNAALFVAANSENLSHADNASLSLGDEDFTVAAWIHTPPTIPGIGIIWDKGGQALGYITSDNAGCIVFSTGGGDQFSGALSIVGNTWYYVICSFEAATNTKRIWINGTEWTAGGSPPTDNANDFRIGSYSTGTAFYYDGIIDEVGFWKRLLTTQEKTDLYNGGAGLTYPFGGGGAALTLDLADGLALGETRGGAAGFARSPGPDALTLAETLARLSGFARGLGETLSGADAAARQAEFARATGDAIAVGESVARAAEFARLTSEAVSLAETLSRSAGFARATSDAMGLGDSALAFVILLREVSDGVSLGEVLALAAARAKALADALAISESVARSAVYLRVVMDGLALADNLARVAVWVRSMAEALSLGDGATAALLGDLPMLQLGRPVMALSSFSAPGAARSGFNAAAATSSFSV